MIKYTLSNTGTIPLNWQAVESSTWLNLNVYSGVIAPNASTDVNIMTDSTVAATMAPGSYTCVIQFNNLTSAVGSTTRSVVLTVLDAPVSGAAVLAITPNTPFSVTVTRTTPYVEP